jgi:hypothetical protein
MTVHVYYNYKKQIAIVVVVPVVSVPAVGWCPSRLLSLESE